MSGLDHDGFLCEEHQAMEVLKASAVRTAPGPASPKESASAHCWVAFPAGSRRWHVKGHSRAEQRKAMVILPLSGAKDPTQDL